MFLFEEVPAVRTGAQGSFEAPGSGGTVSGTFTSANVLASSITTQQFTAGDLASLVDAMRDGLAYVNIHSTVSPGGEVRGQFHTHGKAD